MMKVSKGDIVSVEYTIRLDDDRVIETTVGEVPLSYTHGQNEILQGLEAGLDGMERGAAKVITVEPVDAYGEIHPEENVFRRRRSGSEQSWKRRLRMAEWYSLMSPRSGRTSLCLTSTTRLPDGRCGSM